MEWMKKMVAKLAAFKSGPKNAVTSSDVMIIVSSGILDNEMMTRLVEEFNAHQGVGIYCIGNTLLNIPYDSLRGLSNKTYFVAPDVAEEFRSKAKIAENAGQPLEREIVAVSPAVDAQVLDVVGKYFGATILELKPNEKLFKDFTLCSVPHGVADQFREGIAVQGQFSLELVNE